jgi:hypothetical protein
MQNMVCDESLRFLRTSVSQVVRSVFELYVKSQIRISDVLLEKFKTLPLDAANLAQGATMLPFLDFLKDVDSDYAVKIQQELININVYANNSGIDTALDHFADGDIYSPLTRVDTFVSYFDIPLFSDRIMPLLKISPLGYSDSSAGYSKALNISLYHDDMMGSTAIFDKMEAHASIDANHLMTYFFNSIMKSTQDMEYKREGVDLTDEAEADGYMSYKLLQLDRIIHIASLLKSTESEDLSKINKIVNDISARLTGSSVMLYLAYSANLIGAKTNFVDWAHEVFMKEYISKLDADMINSSGTTTYGTDINDSDGSGSKYKEGDKAYNQIQLGFTNWSFIIDTILKADPNYEKSSSVNKYANMAFTVLRKLLSTRYTVYNTILFSSKKGVNNIQNLIELGIKRVQQIDNITYLKEIKATKDITLYLRDNTTTGLYKTDNSLIVRNSVTSRIVGGIFLKLCYLTLLDVMNFKIQSIQDETDFYTGKSKRELLADKFNVILRETLSAVYKNSNYERHDLKNIVTSSKYRLSIIQSNSDLTNIIDNSYDKWWATHSKETIEKFKRDYKRNDKGSYEKYVDKDIELNNIYYSLYEDKPHSVLYEIGNAFDSVNIGKPLENTYTSDLEDGEIGFIRMGETKFTDIVTDKILPQSRRMFTIEALEQKLNEFEENNSVESEWAYGNYNALAGISTGVMEIKNESDSTFIAPNVDDMAESQSGEESYKQKVDEVFNRITSLLLRKFDR